MTTNAAPIHGHNNDTCSVVGARARAGPGQCAGNLHRMGWCCGHRNDHGAGAALHRCINMLISHHSSVQCGKSMLGRLGCCQRAPRARWGVPRAARCSCTRFWRLHSFSMAQHKPSYMFARIAAQLPAATPVGRERGIAVAQTSPSQHPIVRSLSHRSEPVLIKTS